MLLKWKYSDISAKLYHVLKDRGLNGRTAVNWSLAEFSRIGREKKDWN